MLDAILICGDPVALDVVAELTRNSRLLREVLTVDRALNEYEFVRLLNVQSPDVLLVDACDQELIEPFVRRCRRQCPHTIIIGFGPAELASIEPVLRNLGIHELFALPATEETLDQKLARIIRQRFAPEADESIIAFLSAKGGNGATTVLLNTVALLPGLIDGAYLAIECDLASPVLPFLLNAEPLFTVQDALWGDVAIDSLGWKKLVTHSLGLDFLLAARRRPGPPEAWLGYHKMLCLAVSNYRLIAADLPSTLDQGSFEVLRRAGTVFLVCGADLVSLHVAQDKFQELLSAGVDSARIKVVINRHSKTVLPLDELKRHFLCPIVEVIPDDLCALQAAVLKGEPLAEDTPLGAAYHRLAQMIAGVGDEAPLKARPTVAEKARQAVWQIWH